MEGHGVWGGVSGLGGFECDLAKVIEVSTALIWQLIERKRGRGYEGIGK